MKKIKAWDKQNKIIKELDLHVLELMIGDKRLNNFLNIEVPKIDFYLIIYEYELDKSVKQEGIYENRKMKIDSLYNLGCKTLDEAKEKAKKILLTDKYWKKAYIQERQHIPKNPFINTRYDDNKFIQG